VPQRIQRTVHAQTRARGFTMIELVVVIVILGIIGGMLVPQFLNLGQDARVSAVKSMAGALNAASAQLRAKCGLTPGCPMSSGMYSLPYNGQTFAMWNGYVDAGDSYANVEIEAAITYSGFTLAKTPTMHTFTKDGAPTPAHCAVTYTEALTAGSAATVTIVTSGC
jgi:MSHA pilin protein MshA